MAISANNQGVLSGAFTIPAGIPSGAKLVEFIGEGGSRGTATFVGEGTIVDRVRRNVVRTTIQRYDPLAQTFTLLEPMQLSGAEVFVVDKGTSQLVIQIRDVELGFPTQRILAETRLSAAQVAAGQYNRFVFQTPVALLANREYALVILTDDATYSVGVAELGKFDSVAQRWVTSQPYSVGVLLSSSNASTWTPHQDRDLTFRLLRAKYTETSKTVSLGSVSLSNASDLLLLGAADSPRADVGATYELILPDGTVIPVADGQPIRLPSRVTGDAVVRARLAATPDAAASLLPGTVLASGAVVESATYITRAIPGGNPISVRAVYDGVIPAGAAVAVHYQVIGQSTWNPINLDSSVVMNEETREYTHKVTGINAPQLRVRLTLTGSVVARPRVRNLRVLTT